MEDTTELLTVESIRKCVYTIRGQQVMLDSDLASIYGYEVKRLNEQVKRNISRFPEDFMFQIEPEELPERLKSQIATLKPDNLKSQFATSSWGGKRKPPYAFTEQGIYMLATVLRGELAEQQSIFIMRAFKEMRHYILQNQQFVTQSEMSMVTAKVSELSVQMAGAFVNQYPPLRIKPNPDCHDRLIILDYGFPTEQAFHCGASSKDAGKKLCAINKVESVHMIRPVIDTLLKLPDKSI